MFIFIQLSHETLRQNRIILLCAKIPGGLPCSFHQLISYFLYFSSLLQHPDETLQKHFPRFVKIIWSPMQEVRVKLIFPIFNKLFRIGKN